MDNTSIQKTLTQQQQSQINQQQEDENQEKIDDNLMNTAPEIDLIKPSVQQAQNDEQQDITQTKSQNQQQQANESEINTIKAQNSLVQPQQVNQNNEITALSGEIKPHDDESIVHKKSQSQHNSEAASAGSGHSQSNTRPQQMQAAYDNINSSVNPLLSIGVQQNQQLQKKNFLQPDPEFAEDESEYYSSSYDSNDEFSDDNTKGNSIEIPKREPIVKKIQNTKKIKLAQCSIKSSNKFIFNRFFGQMFSKISKSKYPVSYLAQDGASHSLLHHLTDYKYLSRAVKMQPYFETRLQQRIFPDLCQCMSLRFTIDQQLLWDLKAELQNGIIFQAQICTFCIQDDEVKLVKVSNLYQQACQNEQTITLYAKTDLIKDPLSFMMVELCGYQDNILRSYCHGVVKLSNGFEYKNIIRLQSSKINNLLDMLDSTETILDPKNKFAVVQWENRQFVLQKMKNNRMQCQNVYRSTDLRKIQLFSGTAVQSGDQLQKEMQVCVDRLKNKTVERLSRLPENIIVRPSDLRVLDHGVAMMINSFVHFSGPETFDVSESHGNGQKRSGSRSLSRSRAKSQNKAPSRSASRGKKVVPIIQPYEFDSLKTLKTATAHFESLLSRFRYRVDSKMYPYYDGLNIISNAFNRIYKQRERQRREQMKSSVNIQGIVDRILLPDFVQLMTIAAGAMGEVSGPKEVMDIIRDAYTWK